MVGRPASPGMAEEDVPGPPAPARLHWIDWLRVGAIAGVFLFHTFRPFNAEDWHVKNAQTSDALTGPMTLFWSFGLALLFLLSGAGARFALRRRTWQTFLRERTARLLVPFVVAGVLVLSPIQAALEAIHKGTFQGSFVEAGGRWLVSALNPLDWSISPTFFGRGYHLWFLGFLFAISVLALPLMTWLMNGRGRRVVAGLARAADLRGATLAFAVPIVLLMTVGLFMGNDEHDWFELWWYFGYFVIGFLFVSDDRFLAAVRRDGWLVFGVAAGATVLLFATPVGGLMATMEDDFDLAHFAVGILFAIEGWAWTLVLLNVGLRVAQLQRPVAPRIGDAVLPVYVIHQPVILAVAFFVVGWPVGILPKWLVVFGLSAAITLVLVEIGLRVPLTRVLLGVRRRPAGEDPDAASRRTLDSLGAGHARPR